MDVPFSLPPGTLRELHVSRPARDRYRFDEELFGFTGRALVAHFAAARRFAAAINAGREATRHPERAVSVGEIAAVGLVDEINHIPLRRFRERTEPRLLGRALDLFAERLGQPAVARTLEGFCDEFPPVAVYRREQEPGTWLAGETGGEPHREAALEEIVLLWLNNLNPAFARHRELFDDTPLVLTTPYPQVVGSLHEAFGRHRV
ncbi:MAG TPA: alpha-amylase, partial [Thermoanaerobaculia bacterium]|nr:alpha-amylase [Thermoanaerobaculia bacterium]